MQFNTKEQGMEEIRTDGIKANHCTVVKVNEETVYGEPVENVLVIIDDKCSPVQVVTLAPHVIAKIQELTV